MSKPDTMTLLIDKIKTICLEEPRIIAAYLFGSLAKGKDSSKSDIDVALLLDVAASNFPLLSFITRLERMTGRRTDVIVLNKAGELLKYEVRKHGILLFERDQQARENFEIKGRKTFEDFLFLHGRYVNSVLYGG